MSAPIVRPIGRGWFIVFPDDQDGVVFEVRKVVERSEGCWAEITATTHVGTARWEPRLNLFAATQRAAFAKACEASAAIGRWGELVEAATRALLKARNELPPPHPLQARPPLSRAWLVPGWMPAGEVTTLYGDGGAGKSLFALAVALAGLCRKPLGEQWRVAPLDRVLYLDWESTAEEHEARLWSLLGGEFEGSAAPVVHYHRLRRPLGDVWEALERQLSPPYPFVIIDSALFAASGELDTADSAMGLYGILAELAPASVLVIGHVSKVTADQAKGEGRMYGSVQHRNAPRSSIEFRLQEGASPLDRTVSCYHRKLNTFGGLQGEAAFRFLSDAQGHTLVRPGIRDNARASLHSQIVALLTPKAKTVTELAESLDEKEGVIRTTLSRLANRNMVQRLTVTDGGRSNKTLWGLIDAKRNNEA